MSFVFPKLTVPQSEKDEAWHKKFIQAITNRAISDGYASRYAVANECVNFYLGLQSATEFDYLQKAEDGEVLPAQWINFNKIRVKIDLLLGELDAKGYEIKVKALNKEAKIRRLEERQRLLTEMRLAPDAQMLQQHTGLPLQQDGFVPADEEELDDYIMDDYREESEVIMKYAIKYLIARNHWNQTRRKMFSDLLIQGPCFSLTEIVDGLPTTVRLDPRYVVWDPNCQDDFLSDSTYFGYLGYLSLTDVVDRWQLKQEEIEGCYAAYKEYLSIFNNRAMAQVDFGLLDKNQNLRFFKVDGGDLRVLVLRAWWVDYKDVAYKESKDNYGNTHVKKVSVDSVGDDVIKKKIQVWRTGTLIGGKYMKEWGEIKNQVRNLDSLAYTEPPIRGMIPQYMNNVVVSKVYQLRGLQKLKDIVMYRMQLDIARAGAKGIIYDVAQLPEGWDINTAIKYLRIVGIQFIDSMKDGNPAQFNQFKEYDLTLSKSIEQYLAISLTVDREMDAISGINEARQGSVPNSSIAVGVQQSALLQSNLSTEMYFSMFRDYCSRVLNYQAKLVKLAWAGKEKFSPIIGDTGINFLETDVDLDLNDYAVFAEEIPPMVQDAQMFNQLVTAAVQAGSLGFDQAMELLLEKDIEVALRKFKKETKRRQREAQAQEQQQQQATMQQEQMQLQAQKEQADEDRAASMAEVQTKNAGTLKNTLAKGRIDLTKIPLDLQSKLAQIKAIPKPPKAPANKK